MNENNEQQPLITSVCNAWVICDSKSRPGFKYYFNTLSGHSVWNLSPEEIEKAKKLTKAVPISEIEKYPEPTIDPPIESNMIVPKAGVSQIFNEQVVTRQVPNHMSNVIPIGLMNLSNMPGLPNTRLNPFIWGNPSNNSAIAPTPMMYIAYPQINYQPQEYSQSYPVQLNELSSDYRKPYINNDRFNRNDVMHDMRDNKQEQGKFAQRKMQQTSMWNSNKPDLRQKLIRKRSKSISSESHPLYEEDSEDFHSKHGVQMNLEESRSKYDLSALKQLKAPHSTTMNWVIVVDTEIVLKHFPLLDKITDADQDCYLLVPDHVMKDLHRLVQVGDDVQVRRIFRFLSQQIESQLVFKGGEKISHGEENDDDTYKMLDTCADLAGHNNVILLSDHLKYQKYKNNNSGIHIFTFKELIDLLASSEHNKQTVLRKSPTLAIKIVVPNDKSRCQTPDMESLSISPKIMETIQERPSTSFKLSDNVKQKPIINRNIRLSEKSSAESGAPKEIPESSGIIKRLKFPNLEDDQRNVEKKPEITQPKYRFRKRRNSSFKAKSLSVTSDPAIGADLRRETTSDSNLMLETLRPILPKPVSPVQIPKLLSLILPKPILPVLTKPMSPKLTQPMSPKLTKPMSPVIPKPISPIKTPSFGRSSVSSYKDNSRPKIIIEETSTSGVISNTTVDSDSVFVPPQMIINKTVSVCDEVNFEMFSVAGQSMEEVLRTRREEWVLRFVQIMEECLKEVLQADAPFQSKCCDYRPVWAADLPELARCVIKKFDNFKVVDAANRLSFKLQKIGNTAGANIEPKQYMDLYSFGVYLIKSLKNVSEDCEDLNTAYDSLKKLLYDIQNANLDTSTHDNFAHELNEDVVKPLKPTSSERELPNEISKNTNSTGNLLTSKETPKNQDSQRQFSYTENKFFSSLSLAKRGKAEKPSFTPPDLQNAHSAPSTSSNIAQTPPRDLSSPPTKVLHSPNIPKIMTPITDQVSADKNKDLSRSIKELNLESDNNNTCSPIKTCFVRNFNSIPQFEEKLSKRGQTEDFEGSMDYEYEDYNDDAANDYNQGDDELEDGEIFEDDGKNDNGDVVDAPDYDDDTPDHPVTKRNCEWCMKVFTLKIKGAIQSVISLCSSFVGELRSQNVSQNTQNDMRRAYTTLNRLKEDIDRLLDCSSTTPENSIKLFFKQAKLEDCVKNKQLLLEYRSIISICREEVNACCEKVSLILQKAGIKS